MKLKYIKHIIVWMLFMMFVMMPSHVSAASQEKSEALYVTDGAFTYECFLSKDRTEYSIKNVRIDVSKRSVKNMRFPAQIQGIPVISIGAEVRNGEEYDDDLKNIFGQWVEP